MHESQTQFNTRSMDLHLLAMSVQWIMEWALLVLLKVTVRGPESLRRFS